MIRFMGDSAGSQEVAPPQGMRTFMLWNPPVFATKAATASDCYTTDAGIDPKNIPCRACTRLLDSTNPDGINPRCSGYLPAYDDSGFKTCDSGAWALMRSCFGDSVSDCDDSCAAAVWLSSVWGASLEAWANESPSVRGR